MVSAAFDGFLARMKGQRYDPSKLKQTPQPPSRIAVLLSSFIGSFVGIAIVASLSYNAQWFVERNTPVIAGSFGASAVLIYGAIEAPLSQPRNVIGGHIMSSLIGVSLYKLFNLLSDEMFVKLHWLLCSLAVSISLFLMQLTHTVHPPASASALIAVTGGSAIYDLGYWYVLCPIALGVALMMTVAMLVNNVARRYPTHWWKPKDRKITVVDQDMSTALADFTSPEDEEEDNCTNVGDEQQKPEEMGTAAEDAQPVDGVSHSKEEILVNPSIEHFQQQQQVQSPHSSSHSHAQHLHPHQHHGQLAVYYGGDRNEALREGERLQQSPRARAQASPDLEHGHGPYSPRPTSIVMEVRGSPHPSHPSVSLSAVAEEEYRATIEQLRLRIRELESQIPASN
ncbi:CBS domain-containing membrane protein [Entomortierella parvispora]|uniref:CBS domain-containing membrane protein n=1 Tax=Entomortierella parvispora TaxID=205924 RepID=A0A9P3H8E8_9FUNG|nr:CBS domain-containing membrane protein [Entomortierella parvispora]